MIAVIVAVVALALPPADPLKDATAIRMANLRVIHTCVEGPRIGDLTEKYFSALSEYREATAGAYDEDINGLMRSCANSTRNAGLKATIALLIENDLEVVERSCAHLIPHEPTDADMAAYYGCQATELDKTMKRIDDVRTSTMQPQIRLLAEAMIHVDSKNRTSMLKHQAEYAPKVKR